MYLYTHVYKGFWNILFPLHTLSVLYGYPPQELTTYSPAVSLSDLQLQSGETIIVSERTQLREDSIAGKAFAYPQFHDPGLPLLPFRRARFNCAWAAGRCRPRAIKTRQ